MSALYASHISEVDLASRRFEQLQQDAVKLSRDMFGVQILVQALDLPRSILFVESYRSIVDKMVNFQENKSDATFADEMAHTAQKFQLDITEHCGAIIKSALAK